MALDVILVSHSTAGHRRAYIDQFAALVEGWGGAASVVSTWRATIGARQPVLFLMIEETLGGYLTAAVLRAVLGRRTVGLLFRGREAVSGASLRLRVKRWILGGLKRVPGVSTLSILSFDVEPRLAAVADGWLDDPQLWDVQDTAPSSTALSQSLQTLAQGRRIAVSLGVQNAGKGLNFFSRAWCEDASLRRDWMFAAVGKVAPDAAAAARAMEDAGARVVDRFISDEELASLYGVADVIWAVYRPEYDQASGIFGRALQYGRPVVVRRGSAIASQAAHLNAPAVTIDYGDVDAVLHALSQAGVGGAAASPSPIAVLRARNLERLKAALLGTA